MAINDIIVISRSGEKRNWDGERLVAAANKSAVRSLLRPLTNSEANELISYVEKRVLLTEEPTISTKTLHSLVEEGLEGISHVVARAYKDYRNYKEDFSAMMSRVSERANTIMYLGDRENANADSTLVATKRSLIFNELNKELYQKFFLTVEELEACKKGEIYIHDQSARRDTMNCCLFDMENVLTNGFYSGNMFYNEPQSLQTCGNVISDIALSAASQQYGGFTIPEVDKLLSKYAEKTYQKALAKAEKNEIPEHRREVFALEEVEREAEAVFQGWEYKFNTVASSRGDYPFTTISLGLARDKWGKLIAKTALKVRANGQGRIGNKKPVLFPKIVFLYDENLHGVGKELEDVFEAGVHCSSKAMYPDWLSMSGEGYIASMYKQYGKVISPMGCRAFLSPWYEKGGMYKYDESDVPRFVGRFNIGAVSLNLPMILAKSREESRDFYEVLEYYLNLIRQLHIRTYAYLGELKASTNPLAYCEGGFYGGNLDPDQKLKESPTLLPSATASFGITALNELQQLYNGKSLAEDGQFALDVLKYINKRVDEFKKEDGNLYALYGTPAENLCGLQVKQFRKMYGVVKNVSDREYVSNSFHLHVSEDVTPTQKQDLEYRFWELCNGGKIQYVKYPIDYNLNAVKTLIRRAMAMGLYEGVNMALSYCEECGHQELSMDECPCCHSRNITKIERMNGYLSFSRTPAKKGSGKEGYTRLSDHKMAEIRDRKSM